MANSCLFALVLLAIIKISKGDLSTCNYVYPTAPLDGEPIAMDVCRQIVDNGAVSWRKYRCNATNVFDEEYDNNRASCNGNLNKTDDVTSSIYSFECNAQGSVTVSCEYVMRKSLCSLSDPTSITTYKVEPVIADVCAKGDFNGSPTQYKWGCDFSVNPAKIKKYFRPGPGTCIQSMQSFTHRPDVCYTAAQAPYQEAQYCAIKYYGPTSAPTQEPTMEPTGNPSMEPTKATTNPSAAPSAATSNPSMAPSVKVTDAFYSSTTKQAGSTEADYVPRIQMIGNVIFVSFTVIFMSFVL